MRRNLLLLTFYLAVSILIVSCKGGSTELTQKDKEIIKTQVQKMLENYFEAIRKEGLKAEFDFLDNSADFFWVPPGYNSAISYDSVRTTLEQNSKFIKSAGFYWDTLTINPLSIDIANYTGIVKGSIVNVDETINKVSMIETGTVIRRSNGWKILSGQSRNLPD